MMEPLLVLFNISQVGGQVDLVIFLVTPGDQVTNLPCRFGCKVGALAVGGQILCRILE
jgi:hypothetical protein